MSRKLVIGNKNYSSWSFRAWLLMTKLGVEFDEIRVPLFTPGYKEALLSYSPSGRVPVLIEDNRVVWDSLAIAETLAERLPSAWPADAGLRAHARSVSAEMHAGFMALREALPMNCRATGRQVDIPGTVAEDISRIQTLWAGCLAVSRSRGTWLFGEFSIADAMFAPVASRFRTYGIDCPEPARSYVDWVLVDKAVVAWYDAARAESEFIECEEVGRK